MPCRCVSPPPLAGQAAGPTGGFPVDNSKLPSHRQANMWIENTCQPQDFTQTADRLQLFQTGTDFLLLAQAEKAPLIHLWAGKSLAAVC